MTAHLNILYTTSVNQRIPKIVHDRFKVAIHVSAMIVSTNAFELGLLNNDGTIKNMIMHEYTYD